MNSGGMYESQARNTVDPYYIKGDVFQRDQRYYDQTINSRRNRTPIKSNINNPSNLINPNSGSGTGTGTVPYPPYPSVIMPVIPQLAYPQVNKQELNQLLQENKALKAELQGLTYGGEFGTGDAVIKKNHYTASKAESAKIRQQQVQIRNLQDTVRINNQRLIKYQKASSELELRMNNIQSIDKQIYKQLRTASTRDKQLLERASQALSRGETKDGVIRILQQIAHS